MAMAGRIGFWDIVLYATAMNFGIRWLATAAAAGPESLLIWLLAAFGFLAPLVIASLELAGRYEEEGAIYAWTRRTLGPFAGFMCGWIYWLCNLPFFSAVLYFIVSVAAAAVGGEIGVALMTPAGILGASAALALLVAGLHGLGLSAGKWLPACGAVVSCALLAFLIAAGFALADARGPATDFAAAHYAPPLDANGAILWSTMVFAYGGAEGVALLRNETKGGVAQLARALILVGVFLTLAYVAGSAAMLAILPAEAASRLSGLPEALKLALNELGLAAWAPLTLGVLALALLGQYSAWFGAAARLPFAAGVDRFLPAGFGRRDAKSGAPVMAILLQTGMVIVLLGLSQAGETLESAYDFLVAMGVLSYTLPFVFLFAAYLKAQDRPTSPGAWATPGGAGPARLVGMLGLGVSVSAILGSLVPSPDAPDGLAATGKLVAASLVLIASGALIYWLRRRRIGGAP